MSQLTFDEDTARRIESLYLTADAGRRRRLVRAALGASPGDRVLDVGCGPGFYCLELSAEVGPEGKVVGIDMSPPMLAMAARRCQDLANVSFQHGEVLSLGVEDESFDRVLSVQVMEYVEDATAGLTEMRRALRPGGRVLIWDTDWATVALHSSDPGRNRRVLEAWDRHLAHRSLPQTLGARLRDAGFVEVAAEPHLFTAVGNFAGDSFASVMPGLIAKYVVDEDLIPAAEAEEWLADQHVLSERGEAYYVSTQFCFTASRP